MMATPRGAGLSALDTSGTEEKLRFQVELEFVQCLANPNYLNFLAQRDYLKDPCFINYIKYLQYWKEPEYAKFLKYPMALTFLDLLQYPQFRQQLANAKCAKFIEDQQLLHWQHYIRKRTKLVAGATSAGGSNNAGVSSSGAIGGGQDGGDKIGNTNSSNTSQSQSMSNLSNQQNK